MYKCNDTGETVETYSEYLKTKHWNNIKQQMYKKYRYHCCVCGWSHGIQIHHKTYERVGNESLDDLIYICKACHKLYHDNPDLFKGKELVNSPRGTRKTKDPKRLLDNKTLFANYDWMIERQNQKEALNERRKEVLAKKRSKKCPHPNDPKAPQRTGVFLDSIEIEKH